MSSSPYAGDASAPAAPAVAPTETTLEVQSLATAATLTLAPQTTAGALRQRIAEALGIAAEHQVWQVSDGQRLNLQELCKKPKFSRDFHLVFLVFRFLCCML